MTTNMIIKSKVIFCVNIIIAVLLIGFTFYRRFLVVRLPKNLDFFTETFHFSLFITILIGIIVCIYQTINNLLYLLNLRKNKANLFSKINDIIEDAFFELYNILNYIPNMYDKVAVLAESFYAIFHKHTEMLFLIIKYLIRLIILIAFLIDIFIFFKFDYFYKALYLFCVSLSIRLLFYILRDFASNLESTESVLIIKNKGIDYETQLPITSFSLKEEFSNLDLDYHVKHYILCSKVTGYLTNHDLYKHKFDPYINFIFYFLYLVGWLFVFYKNFMFII